jgi:quercetin dioxygenase-like cupin family protein
MRTRVFLTALLCTSVLSTAVAHDTAGPYTNAIPGVTVDVLVKTDKSWNGTTLPAYPTGQPQISIIRYQFAPGAVLPVHKHPVINAGVLLKGELSVKTERGETLQLKAGDAIVELVDQWHEGRNNGAETAELIIMYSGTPDLPLAIRQQSTPTAAAGIPASKPMPNPSIPYISGGVGDDSMAQLIAREKEFDLKLFLVGQSGSYLSDIRITIIDANGKGVLLTTSEGPVLLANLPAGTYSVKAQKNGHTLEQKIGVTPGKLQTTYFRFPGE